MPNVGSIDSEATVKGVKPAIEATLLESLVASVVKANKAATRIITHRQALKTESPIFFTFSMIFPRYT